MSQEVGRNVHDLSITVANGTSVSDAVEMGEHREASIQCPAALDNATLTWQVSNDGTNWGAAKDDAGVDLANVTLVVSRCFIVPAEVGQHKYWRLKLSGNETAARTFQVHLVA